MLYSLMSTKFRRAFRRILWCRQVCWIYSVYSKDEILRNIIFENGTFSWLKTPIRLSTGPNGHRQPLVEAFREYWILWKYCEIPLTTFNYHKSRGAPRCPGRGPRATRRPRACRGTRPRPRSAGPGSCRSRGPETRRLRGDVRTQSYIIV